MFTSYDRAKHIVEVDERILAVFIVDSTGKISDLFIAEDANIDRSFIETIRTALNIRFESKNGSTKDQPLGRTSLGYIRI
jgi:alkyl hydroperoxide reductase subunit AhpC